MREEGREREGRGGRGEEGREREGEGGGGGGGGGEGGRDDFSMDCSSRALVCLWMTLSPSGGWNSLGR